MYFTQLCQSVVKWLGPPFWGRTQVPLAFVCEALWLSGYGSRSWESRGSVPRSARASSIPEEPARIGVELVENAARNGGFSSALRPTSWGPGACDARRALYLVHTNNPCWLSCCVFRLCTVVGSIRDKTKQIDSPARAAYTRYCRECGLPYRCTEHRARLTVSVTAEVSRLGVSRRSGVR